MLTRSQVDRLYAGRAHKAEAVTPAHSAAEGEMDEMGEMDEETARRRREHVQHEVDPIPRELPEVARADLPKAYDQAVNVPEGYPPMRPVHAERFRRAPATAGHAANSPGYGPPGQAVPVPSATLAPGQAVRPLLTDGRSRPCAPEGSG